MKKYIIIMALAMTTLSAVADITKTIKQYQPQFEKLAANAPDVSDIRVLADSLIERNPKDPFYNLLNLFAYMMQPLDTVTAREGVKAADAGLKNLPSKQKDIRTLCLHIKGVFTAYTDSVAGLNLLKQAWQIEPWAYTYYDLALLSFEQGDTATLRELIDHAPQDVGEAAIKTTKIMLSSFDETPDETYNRIIKYVNENPYEAPLQAAFKIIKKAAPQKLPQLVANLSAEYTPLPDFAEYYKAHRAEVDAELDKIYQTTPEDDRWNVDAARVGLLNLIDEDGEAWNILRKMHEDKSADRAFVEEQMVETAITLWYPFELIELTDNTQTQDLHPEVAVARLKALVHTNRKKDIVNLANYIMRQEPDLAFLAYYVIGLAERDDKQWQKSLDALATSELYSDEEGAIQLIKAFALDKLGQKEQADTLYKQVAAWPTEEMFLSSPEMLQAMGLASLGDKAGAFENAEKILKDPDLQWEDYSVPALVYYIFGEKEKGADLLLKANALYPRAIEYITYGAEWEPFKADVEALKSK